MTYDTFIPCKPEQWTLTKGWITNRALFLLNMMDKCNERFHGGMEVGDAKDSFYPEFMEIAKRYPEQFNRAYGIWCNEWDDATISYVGGKK